jgi:alkylation response protein AidB-like acyl-CoA dehydrogenase
MSEYTVDMRDVKFALFEMLELAPILGHERYKDFGREDFELIIEEAYKLARGVMAPASIDGDRIGATFTGGKVALPESFKKPFGEYCKGGWLSLNHSPEYGGQGAPEVMRAAADGVLFASNTALSLCMMLTQGCAHLIETFGTAELKAQYCEKLYSGKWAGTMCLTEAQAGSDVGACTTRAIPHGDHYLIQGEKIFITFGEHELAPQIVHAVLARIEGAPKGTAGLSLFLVPKFRLDAKGKPGEWNDVKCKSIEHKMGIHGSPTCTLLYGEDGNCHGWLLGEPHKGMKLMFQMMNEARVAVGMQGVSIGNAAYQAALAYARERVQGSDISQLKNPDAPKVTIVKHPDVRLLLAKMRSYGEGLRALMLWGAWCQDMAALSEGDKALEYQGLAELLTPVCKAFGSDMGFRMTEWAVQVLGGYGYLRDYTPEQYLRDVKIASLYEGTNGIQAMDLVGRKMAARGGANVLALYRLLEAFARDNAAHPVLGDCMEALGKAVGAWGKANMYFGEQAKAGKMLGPILNASPYLAMTGDLLVGYLLLWQARVAAEHLGQLAVKAGLDPMDRKAVEGLARTHSEARYLRDKILTARYFAMNELPQVRARSAAVTSGDLSAMAIAWE